MQYRPCYYRGGPQLDAVEEDQRGKKESRCRPCGIIGEEGGECAGEGETMRGRGEVVVSTSAYASFFEEKKKKEREKKKKKREKSIMVF